TAEPERVRLRWLLRNDLPSAAAELASRAEHDLGNPVGGPGRDPQVALHRHVQDGPFEPRPAAEPGPAGQPAAVLPADRAYPGVQLRRPGGCDTDRAQRRLPLRRQ